MEAEAGVRGELFEVGAALRDGAEEVIDLPERDDDGDAGGEAHDDGHRNEADEAAELQKSRGEQQYAGGKAGEEDALQPVLRDDADEHGAHRAGWTGDLIGRTAENGDDDAREDGGDEARGGGRAGADAERQRERQRHGADGQARHDVLEACRRYSRQIRCEDRGKRQKTYTFPPGNTAAWSRSGLHKAPRLSLCGAALKFCTHYNTRKREGQEGKEATLKKR